ncbi:MAG: glutamate racemase [Spirochaetota bacterium]
MNNNPIVFLDSGIGGLPYLEWTRKNLAGERYVYLADRENFPYGKKQPEEIVEIVSNLVQTVIIQFHPKLITLACNTASVVALTELRKRYPSIPFVGVVPAVKPAAEGSAFKKIGILATDRTVHTIYLENLIRSFASDCSVVTFAGSTFVDFIEDNLLTAGQDEWMRLIQGAVEFFKKAEIDTLVLGCTHFIHLEKYLRDALGTSVRLIDSREGVGKQIMRIVNSKTDTSNRDYAEKPGSWDYSAAFYLNCKVEPEIGRDGDKCKNDSYRKIAAMYNLKYEGQLPGV